MKESKEFAGELFDALTRRKGGRKVEAISEDELYEYWVQISDQSFDSRMQIFFNLCDKNADGRISKAEVKEVIAAAIAIGVIFHAGIHLSCDFPRIVMASDPLVQRSIGNDFHYNQPDYWWFLRSVEGITGVVMPTRQNCLLFWEP